MLNDDACRRNAVMGFVCNRRCSRVSHLFFVNDSLVFCRATTQESMEIKALLEHHELASGQEVNFSKSAITFSPNVEEVVRVDIQGILGLERCGPHDKYLGLSSILGRNKRETFRMIRKRLWRKLHLWRSKLFSIGGKEILIKVVAFTIPSY